MKRILCSTAVLALTLAGGIAHAESLLKKLEQEFVKISEEVSPTVVEIAVSGSVEDESAEQLEDLFRFFGPQQDGGPQPDQQRRRESSSMGSGFIFDAEGHIITNNHVVEGAQEIRVRLKDGTELEASLVGRDPSADIAVIKIDPNGERLTVSRMGDSDGLKVGQFAIAMGSPRGLTDSVSFGHISALGREELRLPDPELRFQHFIQTDAPINLGNSGGPLCNIDGEVIGVNVAIAFGANSIGFAIPINTVKGIVPQLIENGKVVRGWLGVSIINVDEAAEFAGQEIDNYMEAFDLPDQRGAVVADVTKRGPAEAAGLQRDDVIRKIEGDWIDDKTDLVNTISAYPPDRTVELEIFREGQKQTIDATLGEFPDIDTARFGPAYLGLRVLDTNPEMIKALGMREDAPAGVVVGQVVDGSPADEAGFRRGDFIGKIAHKDVEGTESFVDLIDENAVPGKTLLVTIVRQGREVQRIFLEVPEDFEMP